MQNTEQYLKKIRTLGWVLSLASAKNKLQSPCEYKWEFPINSDFWCVRDRYRGIFSGSSPIKDTEVINFLQNVKINHYLQDPWISSKFEEYFKFWIQQGSRYKLHNLNLFSHLYFSMGARESFINFYIMNRNKRFRIFKGDYWWHMDVWSKAKFKWAYIEDDNILDNDICIYSLPNTLLDQKKKYDSLVEICNKKGIELLIDFTFLPNCSDTLNIDLSADCIKTIIFSLSKTFFVSQAKIGIRMCKKKIDDLMQMSVDENSSNRLSCGLGVELMQKFSPNYTVNKYLHKQLYWCNELELQPMSLVNLGRGLPYTEWGRTETKNWLSVFNYQPNNYNLSILYENENLLKQLGLCKIDEKR